MTNNLEPDQYQIGNFVFGEGTLFDVEQFPPTGYDVNVQDVQYPNSDEFTFGQDSLKGLPIQMTINVRKNYLLPFMAAITGDDRELDFTQDPTVGQFLREWRADEVRLIPNELKPLYCCRNDGNVVAVYGRPGKVVVTKPTKINKNRQIVCEYRRVDSLAYNEFEWFAKINSTDIVSITRIEALGMGDAPTWVRILLLGPMTHPIIQFGNFTLNCDIVLNVGEIAEINSFPWTRRFINLNTGVNYANKLTGVQLENLSFPATSAVEISWNASGINETEQDIDFSDYSNGNLPDPWIVDYSPPESGGSVIVQDGLLQWDDDGNDPKLGTFIYNVPTLTDYQLVRITERHPPPFFFLGNRARNRIIGRCSEDRTNYLYWDITYDQCFYGWHHDGGDEVFWSSTLKRLLLLLNNAIDDVLHLRFNDGNPFENWVYEACFGIDESLFGSTLTINGVNIVNTNTMLSLPPGVTDFPSGYRQPPMAPNYFKPTIGPNNRLCGGGMYATSEVLGQNNPAPLSKFYYRDNAPPSVAPPDESGVYLFWQDAWQEI